MRVFVFGATGYVGGALVRRLIAAGHAVTALVRSDATAQRLKAAGADPVIGDALELTVDAATFGEHDAVIWAAQVMLEDEERIVGDMLKALRETAKAFIFTSGTSLLSQPTGGDWSQDCFAEDDDFVPRRQVAPRKAIETMVRVAAQSGVRAMVVRPPMIWGHGGCRLIADLYHSARRTGAVCYVGRGLNCYTHVHVDDLAELFLKALERGSPGALYHAASGEVSFREMAATIARHLGVPTRSIGVVEAAEVWDRFMGPIVFSGCSRTRAPRSRLELEWYPDPDRCDLLQECVAPSYALAPDRELPSWVRRH